jgi:hypothetical protein
MERSGALRVLVMEVSFSTPSESTSVMTNCSLLKDRMNDPSESNNNYMTPYHNHQTRRPTDSLLKQTYSTTSYEDGQVKYWHVVAYTNKVGPLFRCNGV